MKNDDPVKMRTEILQQVASLQLESTFLHLRLAAKRREEKSNEAGTILESHHEGSRSQYYLTH